MCRLSDCIGRRPLTWVLAYFVLICSMAVGAVVSAHETAKASLES